MLIYPKYTAPVRPDATRGSQADAVSPSESILPAASTTSSPDRSDRVEISNAGRALAARTDDVAKSSLDPARAAVIRGRVMSGAYDTLEVVDAVARRLLNSGDL